MPSGARLSARQDQAKQQMVLLFNYFVGGYKQANAVVTAAIP